MLDRPNPNKAGPPEEKTWRYLRTIAIALEALLIKTRTKDKEWVVEKTHQHFNEVKLDLEIRRFSKYANVILWLAVFVATGALTVSSVFFAQIASARRIDRPYISVSNDYGNITWEPLADGRFDGLGRVVWTWSLTNYGRDLALGVSHYDKLGLNWKFRSRGNPDAASQPVPVPPNMKVLGATVSTEVLTKEAFDWAMATEGIIHFRSKILYSDRYGKTYETDVCQFHRPDSPAPGTCLGNDMK